LPCGRSKTLASIGMVLAIGDAWGKAQPAQASARCSPSRSVDSMRSVGLSAYRTTTMSAPIAVSREIWTRRYRPTVRGAEPGRGILDTPPALVDVVLRVRPQVPARLPRGLAPRPRRQHERDPVNACEAQPAQASAVARSRAARTRCEPPAGQVDHQERRTGQAQARDRQRHRRQGDRGGIRRDNRRRGGRRRCPRPGGPGMARNRPRRKKRKRSGGSCDRATADREDLAEKASEFLLGVLGRQ
jgi:hypothetical protein